MQVSLNYSSLIYNNGAPTPSVIEGEVLVRGTGSEHIGAVMSAGSIALVSISGVAVLLICLCMTEISKSLAWSRRLHRNVQAVHDRSRAARAQVVAGSNPGLARSVIKRIPVAKYKRQQQRIPNNEINQDGAVISAANCATECVECAVCLSSFEEDEPVRILPHCAHAFHLPCIDRWFESHSTCPLCRMEITLDIAKKLILQLPAEATQQSINDIRVNGFASNDYELHHAEVHHHIDHRLAPALNVMIDPEYSSGAEESRQYIITTQASTGTSSTNNNLFSSTDNSSNNVHSVAVRWPWQPQYSAVFSSLRRSLSTGLTHGGGHYSQVWKAARPSIHMSARFHMWNSEDLLHAQAHESQV